MKKYFVTATGTNLGKTYLMQQIIHQLLKKQINFAAIKPVISGFSQENIAESDVGLIIKAQNLPITEENTQKTSLYQLKTPLSPDIAAFQENIDLEYHKIMSFCSHYNNEMLLIEGAGGICSPICLGKTNIDLASELNAELIIVAGCYLGAISHLLSAVKVANNLNVKIKNIVINEKYNDEVSVESMIYSLSHFLDIKPTILSKNGDFELQF